MGKRGAIPFFPIFFAFYMTEHDPISIVHSIFVDFFGEENVDLQGQIIIVHFPKVTVTNENNRSVDITHLWVKVQVSLNGTIDGTFQMMRSEFTATQFASGYSHSHLPSIKTTELSWGSPCLGDGPIRGTISSLSIEFSEEMWNLFCLELSKYVTVESLTGGPYIRLETIGTDRRATEEITFPLEPAPVDIDLNEHIRQSIAAFIPAILSKKPFGFNFFNGSYGIAMSERDLFITLSNLFIEFYNSLPASQQTPIEDLFFAGILCKGKLIGNKLYYVYDSDPNAVTNYRDMIGRDMLRFKDKTITLNITEDSVAGDDPNMSIFLSDIIVRIIIDRILRTINNKYGQSNQEDNFFGRAHRYL